MLGACRSLHTRKGNNPFVYGGSLGPVILPATVLDRLNRLGQTVVDSHHLSGLFNTDVIVDQQGDVWLLEINSRWSSSMELIERALNHPAVDGNAYSLIDHAIHQQRLQTRTRYQGDSGSLFLKRIVYARQTHAFSLADWTDRLRPNQSLHDVPADGHRIGRREPVLTLITRIDPGDSNALKSYSSLLRCVPWPHTAQ